MGSIKDLYRASIGAFLPVGEVQFRYQSINLYSRYRGGPWKIHKKDRHINILGKEAYLKYHGQSIKSSDIYIKIARPMVP